MVIYMGKVHKIKQDIKRHREFFRDHKIRWYKTEKTKHYILFNSYYYLVKKCICRDVALSDKQIS